MEVENKITVITVVKNEKKNLDDTINNIINLPVKVDYIIIDGCSSDGTIDVIKKYSNYIKSWISEKDCGIYDAMNKGWRLAELNSHVLYIGAGDKINRLPQARLEKDIIYYGNVFLGEKVFFRSKVSFFLKLGNTLHHQALLIPKKICPTPPFDIKFKTYADFDFNQRLYKRGAKFHFIPEFTSFALPYGISSKFNKKESLQVVKKNYGFCYLLLAKIYYAMQNIKTFVKSYSLE